MATEEKFLNVFSKALGVPVTDISDNLKYNSIPKWDSTAHMILIAALEDEYDILLDTDDIIDMSSVLKAKEILAKYDIVI